MKKCTTDIIRRIITSNCDGFTLLESLIATAVFAIGILGVAAMQLNSVNSNSLAEEVQQNTVVAMEQIEELMATDYSDQRIQNDGSDCNPSADGKFTLCVERLDNAAIPGTKKIVVTSQFVQNGRPQSVTMKIFKPLIK